ncbi:MAG: PaaI family thioesterase [Phycisphaerae bacterium]|nr:PaaI family thioesterase [Phycisphaerae bacterium]
MTESNYFSKDNFAKHVGIELIESSKGYAKAKMEIQDCHINGVQVVQGGAIYSLAIWTFAIAANTHGMAVGLSASIQYTNSVSRGTLYAEAKENVLGQTVGSYSVTVTDDRDNIVAVVQAMSYRKRNKSKKKA